MTVTNKRSPSDSVLRISKAVSDAMFARLKSFNDLYAKDSKQWKYFTYCRDCIDWSLAKENSDWKNENLPALKHATLKWLVKSLVLVSEWDGKSFYMSILEILKALQLHGEGYALFLSDECIRIGLEYEYFDSVQEILRIQRSLIERMFQNTEKQAMLHSNFGYAENARECSIEILEMEYAYFQIYSPVKSERAKSGRIRPELLDGLSAFCYSRSSRPFKTTSARRIFLSLEIARLLIQNQPQDALKKGEELMSLYSQYPWLRNRFSNEYHRNAVDIAALAIVQNESSLGERYYQQLIGHLSNSSVSVQEKVLYSLLAKARLHEMTGSKADAEEALGLLRSHKAYFLESKDRNLVGWGLFFCIKAAMKYEYWDTAREILLILDQPFYSLNDAFSTNVRVMHLLCLLEIENDREYLVRFCETAVTFISRKSNGNSLLKVITTGIKRALMSDDWTFEIGKLIIQVEVHSQKFPDTATPEYFAFHDFLSSITRRAKNHQ